MERSVLLSILLDLRLNETELEVACKRIEIDLEAACKELRLDLKLLAGLETYCEELECISGCKYIKINI